MHLKGGYWALSPNKLGMRYRRACNARHTYTTTMLMASMTPAFWARPLGGNIEVFLRTYFKWLDGARNDMEMARLDTALGRDLPPTSPKHPEI